MNDEQIIELYFQRSESAISETDKKYGAGCRRLTFNILGSREDSEECVNDTYLKCWNTMPPKRPPELKLFIAKIARNIALNMRRAVGTLKRGGGFLAVDMEEVSECLPSRSNVEQEVDEATAAKAIDRFLASLDREKQIIFVRRYWYFCTITEIANDLGLSESKVKMTLSRTREKLREYLGKEGINV